MKFKFYHGSDGESSIIQLVFYCQVDCFILRICYEPPPHKGNKKKKKMVQFFSKGTSY